MPNTTSHLALPFIEGGQAQKHVTHNEALRTLDTVVQLSVTGVHTAPDPAAQDGDRALIGPGATDEFAGRDGNIAVLETGIWVFTSPQPGWVALDRSTNTQRVWDGSSWSEISTSAAQSQAPSFGINTSADTTNRLSVAADATLLSHDTQGGHQLKVNKSGASDTASLLFQSGFSGRAELGLTGSDDLEIKVSDDGAGFTTALSIDAATGAVSLPQSQLSAAEFGAGALLNTGYALARDPVGVTNATGVLGNGYNFPASHAFDSTQTPGLPGAFVKTGHYSGAEELSEFLAPDPNQIYRISAYLRQEGTGADFSSFANEDRHQHQIGLRCYDPDGLAIEGHHHARYAHGGTDSLTTLTQPLAPGDTVVHVADASGWNESDASADARGLIIFGYKDASGRLHAHYSRIEAADLFALGSVDKGLNQITLNQGLPGALGNPDDGGGIWPIGTPIANRRADWGYKLCLAQDVVLDATDTWYHMSFAIGGVDRSGTNAPQNFAPGTSKVRPALLLNYSNRAGGFGAFPDTGSGHRVWISGLTVTQDPSAAGQTLTDGSVALQLISGDPTTGAVTMSSATRRITQP